MTRSSHAAPSLAATAAVGLLALSGALLLRPSPAVALPIPTGSQCNSTWVNNAGAMSCFIQGEDEVRNGARHPHYVACAGGDIFCCVDNDNGNQNCVAQARGRPANRNDWIRAILGAHKTMLTRMDRYAGKPRDLQSRIPERGRDQRH